MQPRTWKMERSRLLNRTRTLTALIGVMVLAAACAGTPAADVSSEPATSPTAIATPMQSESESASPTSSPSPTESAAEVGACLDPAIVAAFDEARRGELDTDPALTEMADAFDSLELEGNADDARDSFVDALREDPPVESMIVSAGARLQSEIAIPEC